MARASAAERTCGVITPIAPPSSTRQIYSGVLAGTRTSGVMPICWALMQIWQQRVDR